ncbi:hypothetical protein LTR36_005636 [Oleoguttula mirabilis]|uniref:SH3 domain-containing protein n=1 Tax=Oleoguttula mirabilis TaxID=1507867 RepID=A0AAV9JDN4_9PEZI|nr:hypothetical protein LTR36_005636 [Oleoguttula mirabilis]
MAEVLSAPPPTSPHLPPPASAPTPTPLDAPPPTSDSTTTSSLRPRERPRPSERVPSFAHSRMSQSQSSHHRSSTPSRSRPQSSAFPAFPSSLSYAVVRDFAYPVFHPMHYGAPPDPPSRATTPGSEWNSGGRRLSDPGEETGGASSWSAGPWGGDGAIYGDPESEDGMESLPSTSFGEEDGGDGEGMDEAGGSNGSSGKSSSSSSNSKTHRKSKSYANFSDYERGRRRESAGQPQQQYRRSRASGGEAAQPQPQASIATATDMFHFGGQQSDPAGRDTLRQSRSYGQSSTTDDAQGAAQRRRDSHFQTMLPNRSFAAGAASASSSSSSAAQREAPPRLDSDMPLDAEIPTSPTQSYSPQRQSIGPEDEELYAGQSLALYSFEPENANELRLREGQVIMVSYRHGQGWLVAEDPESGEQGLVPEEYVRLLSELPHYDPETGLFREVEVEDGLAEGEGEGDGDDDGLVEEEEDGGVVDGETATRDMSQHVKETRVDEAYEEAEEQPLKASAKRKKPEVVVVEGER